MVKNAGKYNRQISIYKVAKGVDSDGFPTVTETLVIQPYAEVKTTKGFTLIMNNTAYEKALTRFTFRYTKTAITYDMVVKFRGKTYSIEYINNIDEAHEEIELECKEVREIGTV
jgi:SPP1 family predicted phage head-tail adaptor